MKKILTVIGARPQFIKVGPVSRELSKSGQCSEIIVHTGQHFDDEMSDIFFRQLDLPRPSVNLGIAGHSHASQTAAMMMGLEPIIEQHSPKLVLVYGDTNSTLAGALTAAKLNVPIAHVEAGLRSFNRRMPEEINRIITDQISSLLFTPSDTATENLVAEGIKPDTVFQFGDVMYDAVLNNIKTARATSRILDDIRVSSKGYFLLTLHRAENTDDDRALKFLVAGLLEIARTKTIVFPIHPRTRKALSRQGLLELVCKNMLVTEPKGYLDTLTLIENASLLLTDSGGMQKEAMFLKTPCITLRSETEWVETVDIGANSLYNTGSGRLSELIEKQLERNVRHDQHPYGTGQTAASIVTKLLEFVQDS